jgi:hypothetical protein
MMMSHMVRFHACLPPLTLALLLAGCGSTARSVSADEGRPPDPTALGVHRLLPRPFPAAFQEQTILVADRISIEGPMDLLEHVAIRPDSEYFDYRVSTTEKGLLQIVRRKPGAEGGEIRCQLDNWQIAALEELLVLQRPGEVPVTVIADGEAVYIPGGGSPERREPRLTFRYGR